MQNSIEVTHIEEAPLQAIDTQLNQLPRHMIDQLAWTDFPYRPNVDFAIAHANSFLYLKYFIEEHELKANYSRLNDPVYKDSCVEFFVALEGDENYYNFEFNCLGVCLCGYGPGRGNRQRLPETVLSLIETYTQIHKRGIESTFQWEISIAIPVEVFCFRQIESLQGMQGRANFYKCGDELRAPHYLSWSRINTEKPDFHRPEFFGLLRFN